MTKHTIKSLLARTVEEGTCKLWTGVMRDSAPSVMVENRKYANVRKVVWQLHGHRHIDGACYYSSCGVAECVKYEHIAVMTRSKAASHNAKQNNYAQQVAQCRANARKMAVIDDATLDYIMQSDKTNRAIARELGLNEGTVGRYRNGTRGIARRAGIFSGLLR